MRKTFKKTTKHEKIKHLIEKFKISEEYISVNRRMIANAIFIGLFITFIPMPMQMLAVIALMPFKKFNVPIALVLCWITNPFTMPFIYYIEYSTGSFFLGLQLTNIEMSLDWIQSNIDDIFIPLYLGAFFYSTVFSTVGYFIITHFWKTSVYNDKKLHRNDRK